MDQVSFSQEVTPSCQPVWITWEKTLYQLGLVETAEAAAALKARFCTDEGFRNQIIIAQLQSSTTEWFPALRGAGKIPPRPEWLRRLATVKERLQKVTTPFLDRASVEELFGVSPSTALRILRHFGARHAGKSCVIEREVFLNGVEQALATDEYHAYRARATRVAEEIAQARANWDARERVITNSPKVRERRLADLPATIHLEQHKLTVEFASMQEFIQRIADLVFLLQNDYGRVEQFIEEISKSGECS